MRLKIKDLPDALQRKVQAQIDAEDARRKPATAEFPQLAGVNHGHLTKPSGEPNKTELAYRREVLDRDPTIASIHYEGLTFRQANGHRYTPDYVTIDASGHVTCHEVKGSYRLGSYQRAKLAFDQAAVEFPWATWIWAERSKDHGWTIKRKALNSVDKKQPIS